VEVRRDFGRAAMTASFLSLNFAHIQPSHERCKLLYSHMPRTFTSYLSGSFSGRFMLVNSSTVTWNLSCQRSKGEVQALCPFSSNNHSLTLRTSPLLSSRIHPSVLLPLLTRLARPPFAQLLTESSVSFLVSSCSASFCIRRPLPCPKDNRTSTKPTSHLSIWRPYVPLLDVVQL
jgi:hypothetical protein